MPEDITVALLFFFVTHSALVADVGFLFVPSPKMDLDFEHFQKKISDKDFCRDGFNGRVTSTLHPDYVQKHSTFLIKLEPLRQFIFVETISPSLNCVYSR